MLGSTFPSVGILRVQTKSRKRTASAVVLESRVLGDEDEIGVTID